MNFLVKICEFYGTIAFFVFVGLVLGRYENDPDAFTKSVLAAAVWPLLAYEEIYDRKFETERFDLEYIEFQAVDYRGRASSNAVMFTRFRVKASNAPFPQVVELRGHTSVMMVVLNCDGDQYVILVKQPRIASGFFNFAKLSVEAIKTSIISRYLSPLYIWITPF